MLKSLIILLLNMFLFTITALGTDDSLNAFKTSWQEARDSSTISVINNVVRSTADGSATFGMSKELSNLVVGQEYTLSYSFLTGTSSNLFFTQQSLSLYRNVISTKHSYSYLATPCILNGNICSHLILIEIFFELFQRPFCQTFD